MLDTPATPKPRESTWLWLYKLFAGLMIVVILGIHFVVNHLAAPGGLLTYTDVIRYYDNPLIPIMEAFFLIFVVSHALVGVRSIVLDLNPSDSLLSVVDWVLIATGLVASGYGIWLLIEIASR